MTHPLGVVRVLLLVPTHSYRASSFLEAARSLGVEVVVGSDRRQTLAEHVPGRSIALDFPDEEGVTRAIADFAREYPLAAIVPTDDETAVLAARAAAALSLPGNSVDSAVAARDKRRMRELLSVAGIPSPPFQSFRTDADPRMVAGQVDYPSVVKPLSLSASRGVIRVDDPDGFVAAFGRLVALLGTPEITDRCGPAARQILVERYVPGVEVALEGLLTAGELRVLALFDKPDPLEGPFFEETIYVTPSRLPANTQRALSDCAARAARALGLLSGPVHAELRWNDEGPWLIEMAARSIGGLCSRTLRFGVGRSLEELILRHATGMTTSDLRPECGSAGVMMIPIPCRGVLHEVRGVQEARAVLDIEEVVISIPQGQELVPLPEGNRYLGFIFARAATPERVERSLRAAHARLELVIV